MNDDKDDNVISLPPAKPIGDEPPRGSKLATRRLQAAEKRIRALALRRIGFSYAQIAREVGYRNKGGAYEAVMQELNEGRAEATEEVRLLELERLDRLQAALWPKAVGNPQQGDAPDLPSLDRVLKIMERRAAISGLNTQRIEHSGPAGGPVEIQVVEDVVEFRALIELVARDARATAIIDAKAIDDPVLPAHANGQASRLPPELRP